MMDQQAVLDILPDHVDGRRDFRVFDHFLEHFHRQIYGGVYNPGTKTAFATTSLRPCGTSGRRGDFSVECPDHPVSVLSLE